MMTAGSDRFDQDVIARLTGLNLDPETPAHLATSKPEAPDSHVFTLRSLVSTKEAGVIIGKQGKNISEIREATTVKAGVSKVVPGVHERVLSITGSISAVAEAFAMVAQHFLENPTGQSSISLTGQQTSVRLLIPHQLMGNVIGKAGANIREIQTLSGAKMIISKEMLPQSTERTMDVVGSVENIKRAVQLICSSLETDIDRFSGIIQYDPKVKVSQTLEKPFKESQETRTIPIPADMVGCLIGRGGSSINNVRRLSNAFISIAKDADPITNEREFTISGTGEAIEKALQLLYSQLEKEKLKRSHSDLAEQ